MSSRRSSSRQQQQEPSSDVIREHLLAAEEMSFDGNITEPSHDSLSSFVAMARRVGKDRVKRNGEREIIRRVLDEIDVISVKRMSEGFNQWNFSSGVFNCFFIMYIFGKLSLYYLSLCCAVSCIIVLFSWFTSNLH